MVGLSLPPDLNNKGINMIEIRTQLDIFVALTNQMPDTETLSKILMGEMDKVFHETLERYTAFSREKIEQLLLLPLSERISFAHAYRSLLNTTENITAERLCNDLNECNYTNLYLMCLYLNREHINDPMILNVINFINNALSGVYDVNNQTIQYDHFYPLVVLYQVFGDMLNFEDYWDIRADLKTNLASMGITPFRLLNGLVKKYVNEVTGDFKHIEVKLTTLGKEQLYSLFNFDGSIEGVREIIHGVIKNESAVKLNICLKGAVLTRTHNTVDGGIDQQIIDKSLFLFAWFSNYRSWTSRRTSRYSDRLNCFVRVHHHTVINALTPEDLIGVQTVKTNPETALKAVANRLLDDIEEKHSELLKMGGGYHRYPSFDNLPPSIQHLSNYLLLSDEGEIMKHCCGGYDDSCKSGTSVFFHYDDNSRYGYTIELRRMMSDVDMSWFNGRRATPKPKEFIFRRKSGNYDLFTIHEIRGHSNRAPSKEVMKSIETIFMNICSDGEQGTTSDRLTTF